MAPAAGNKNNYKWTKARVSEVLDRVRQVQIDNPAIYSLVGLFTQVDLYPEWLWHQKKRYADDPHITHKIKIIENVSEARLVEDMLTGIIKHSPAQFVLKCNYGYQEKSYIESSSETTGTINVNIRSYSAKKLE
jgi:hypothetical protein